MNMSLSFIDVLSDFVADPGGIAPEMTVLQTDFATFDSALLELSPELRALSFNSETVSGNSETVSGGSDFALAAQGLSHGAAEAALDIGDAWFGTMGNDRYALELNVIRAYGHAGQDILTGAGRDESFYGGAGRDTVFTGDGVDFVDGGRGHDVISAIGTSGIKLFYGRDGNDDLHGGRDDDTLFGGSGQDVLVGYEGNDAIRGGRGHDKLHGEDPNDDTAPAFEDELFGGAGHDTLFGYGGTDSLNGGAGDDTLYGGGGADTVMGKAGDDVIVDVRQTGSDKSPDSDIYFGGKGADTFIFRTPHMGRDRIEDFEFGVDVLDLRLVSEALAAISETTEIKIRDTAAGVVFKVDADNKVTVVDADLDDFLPGDYLLEF